MCTVAHLQYGFVLPGHTEVESVIVKELETFLPSLYAVDSRRRRRRHRTSFHIDAIPTRRSICSFPDIFTREQSAKFNRESQPENHTSSQLQYIERVLHLGLGYNQTWYRKEIEAPPEVSTQDDESNFHDVAVLLLR